MQRKVPWFPLGVGFGAAIGTALMAPWKRCFR
jgi:hypothetical protein